MLLFSKICTHREKRQDLLEQISPDSDAFEKEDDEFYEYEDNLEELLINFKKNG